MKQTIKPPADPNELRKLPRLLRAIAWRLPLEMGELTGKMFFKQFDRCIDPKKLVEFIPERGEALEGTAVTSGQRKILFRALDHTAKMPEGIAEIGAWEGITTVALAQRTRRRVYAVDPHYTDEFAGINEAFEAFGKRTASFANVAYVRQSSGDAARQLAKERFSLVFVDAIHDYINTWYDFVVWGQLLAPGGIIVFHDVDDHPGTNLACQKILRQRDYRVWGYCPNIVAFEKISVTESDSSAGQRI
jgi:predicted O-methyltransferase YrrM